jgi:hypothetical protein
LKTKTCKICKEKFVAIRQLQPTCENLECMIAYANKHLNKKAEENKTKARVALRQFNSSDINILKRLAQKLFNQFIRERDKNEPCVSCQKIIGINEISHASHFRPATN